MGPLLQKYLPLYSNTSSKAGSSDEKLQRERQKDHYSHFILRLAFSSTEDLRRRFARIETSLFRLRFQLDDLKEKQAFIRSLDFDWQVVSDDEKRELGTQLSSATPGLKSHEVQDGGWFKVDWERVPELVEARKVLLRQGKAYVPVREQLSMVLAEFTMRLDKGLEVRLPSRTDLHIMLTQTSLLLERFRDSTKMIDSRPFLTTSRRTSRLPTRLFLTLTLRCLVPQSTRHPSTTYRSTSRCACEIFT